MHPKRVPSPRFCVTTYRKIELATQIRELKISRMKKLKVFLLALAAIIATTFLISFQTNTKPMLDLENDNYEAHWKTIDSLEHQGLPKSALENVLLIYEKAKSEENAAQIIKCLIYRGKYESQLEEDGLVNAIFKWETEIETAKFPVKQMLQSMLAEMYQGYLNNNRWRFQNRTETGEFKKEDIRTWTIEQLIDKSGELYKASLSEKGTQKVKLEDFDAILYNGDNSMGMRPTLFDFLAHRAIDYFMNEQAHLTQPAYKFYIDNPEYFSRGKDFANIKIETKDTDSYKYQTLLLFQDLIKFRLQDENVATLGDVELKLWKFLYDNSISGTKATEYDSILQWAAAHYTSHPIASEFYYQRASLKYELGQNYQPNPDEAGKWLWKQALEICEKGIEIHPKSIGANLCKSLKISILHKSINIQAEQVNLPNAPFLTAVDYQNTSKVFVKVIRMNEERLEKYQEQQQGRDREQQIIAYFNSLPSTQTHTIDLLDDGDYRQHSTEIKIDKLPYGHFVIMVSDNQQFTKEKGAVGFLFTTISNLGFWQRTDIENRNEFFVFDRRYGTPQNDVKAEYYTQHYNSIQRKYEYRKEGEGWTDADGFVLANLGKDKNFRVLFQKGRDSLFLGDHFYNYRYRHNPRTIETMHFFLDRAIYRPGQTIYFKGILVEKDPEGMPRILANQKISVFFQDANHQQVERLDLTTNEYGTVNGTFIAPKTGLLGSMSIYANTSPSRSSKYFRVEEYKRPKFEVGFDPLKESYRLDEEVLITGFAKAYAGSNIDGAKVSYRVVREVRFPWLPWWYFRRGYNPWNSESMEIVNGTTQTDAEGKFEVKFTALPDRSIPADKKPEFRYTVYADVIDITGETHSSQTSIRVGTVALDLSVTDIRLGSVESLDSIEIFSKNLNGQFEPATGSLKIELLEAPKQTFTDRFWAKPDKPVLEKNLFKRLFPNFAYQDEDEYQNWPTKKMVHAIDFDTEKSTNIDLSYLDFEAGKYALTIVSEDKYGMPVELQKYFDLYDLKNKKLPAPEVGWHILEKSNYQPGETAEIYLGTSEKKLMVLFEVEKDQSIISRKWLEIGDLKKETLKIEASDRGNVHYHYSYAQQNRSFNNQGTLAVPWSNKELSIEYGTFRDKLLPGQEEEWLIKIKGPKGEKVAAEMVAGMYDASLDVFAPNNWGMRLFPTSYARRGLRHRGYASHSGQFYTNYHDGYSGFSSKSYKRLNWFNFHFYENRRHWALAGEVRTDMAMSRAASPPAAVMEDAAMDEVVVQELGFTSRAEKLELRGSRSKSKEQYIDGVRVEGRALDTKTDDIDLNAENPDFSNVKVRTNLNETVFFFPNLMTDEAGNVLIKFTMNEALTKWKFLGLAHTKDLKIGATTNEVVTQKDLMVMPNPPRFFREHDQIEFTAKVVNLSEDTLNGNYKLELKNAMTGMDVFSEDLSTLLPRKFENLEPGASQLMSWRFKVPDVSEVPMIEHTVFAQAGDFSDAERSAAPVLSNRMLVTETKPLPVRGNESKVFTFQSLRDNTSTTLKHHAFTLEFTQNPAWYAVQALPYLMEYPYECTEQIFNRYYANSLATSVANSHPKIKAVFDKWRDYQPEALLSNLSKNQELKTALLEETPWVLNAQIEELQKKNIALLFDLNRMSYEQEIALAKLAERQLANGGWAWFPGGRDNWYITQYVVEGMGHLDKLSVKSVTQDTKTWGAVQNAIRYCDARMLEMYEDLEYLVKQGKAKWEDDHLNNMAIHYLYSRTFFLEDESAKASLGDDRSGKGRKYVALEGKSKTVFDYYLRQAETYWLKKGMYQEGMLSLALHRMAKGETTAKMVKSFKERSLTHEELGMYWKSPSGYMWYELPIETHSLMIEVFEEVADDAKSVDDLKVWLLKNKQTNHWKTTKATSSAVYALLISGDNWLVEDAPLEIDLGISDWQSELHSAQKNAEAGTGYFKVRFDGDEVTKAAGTIKIKNPNNHPAWGAAYWQYFEQLDKIETFEETPLTLKKQLFKVENSPTGEVMTPISEGEKLEPGDKLHVRIELRVDRSMEYVHMKDMRASGFEPMNVYSRYKWQGGLGYYESTRDASTNFFFSRLPKGTHVFEYPLRVIHKGDFSNGVTTIQCMYAPEFTSHSEGIRVEVE